jgi:4,5-DOPA dioxygenase extradiol
MYPEANIPVLQLSVDYNKSADYGYALAKELAELLKKRGLIMGKCLLDGNHKAMLNYQQLSKWQY